MLTLLRYAEGNAVRAGLAKAAEQWSWCSARYWEDESGRPTYLVPGPVARPKNWLKWVNRPLTDTELEALRRCVNRGTPYGSAAWVERTAKRLGLESTLRPRGRPRKKTDRGQ